MSKADKTPIKGQQIGHESVSGDIADGIRRHEEDGNHTFISQTDAFHNRDFHGKDKRIMRGPNKH
jgi:hypothetical protein